MVRAHRHEWNQGNKPTSVNAPIWISECEYVNMWIHIFTYSSLYIHKFTTYNHTHSHPYAKLKNPRIPPYKLDGSLDTGQEAYEPSGAKSVTLTSVSDLLSFMTVIDLNRSASSHNLNARSSRSHCVISVTLNGLCLGKGKLLMVDLAGSERLNKSGSTGTAASEARNINTSLSALGRVISALSSKKGKKKPFVPYRDSSLTMLLKQSLGGQCVTTVVTTISGEVADDPESSCTLQFGQRCAQVEARELVKLPNVGRSADFRYGYSHIDIFIFASYLNIFIFRFRYS